MQLFAEIGVIDRLAATRMERALPHAMSQAQFQVLTRLALAAGPQTPTSLARAFHVTKGAMTNTLQRTVARGWVGIEGDEADGRRKQAQITPAGLAVLDEAVAALRPMTEDLRGAFDDAAFEAALPFLRALRGWLNAAA